MDDLVKWLRAQLDEDHEMAQVANALTHPPWVSQVTRDATGYDEGKIVDQDGYAVVHVEDQTPERAVAEHIARWDPVRVLAEVHAKRRILDLHDGRHWCTPEPEDTDWHVIEAGEEVSRVFPCLHLRLLALPYADRPGFDPVWAESMIR